MKARTITAATYYAAKDPRAHRYPNAAKRRFYAEKIVDGILAAAITVATIVILLFLFIAL
jgi:hypothetical protein